MLRVPSLPSDSKAQKKKTVVLSLREAAKDVAHTLLSTDQTVSGNPIN